MLTWLNSNLQNWLWPPRTPNCATVWWFNMTNSSLICGRSQGCRFESCIGWMLKYIIIFQFIANMQTDRRCDKLILLYVQFIHTLYLLIIFITWSGSSGFDVIKLMCPNNGNKAAVKNDDTQFTGDKLRYFLFISL